MKRPWLLFLALLGGMPAASNAQRPPQDYGCLKQDAGHVQIVRVSDIAERPVISTAFGDLFVVTLITMKSFKGEMLIPGKEGSRVFQMFWRKADPHEARFVVGQEYLAFLDDFENGPVILGGFQGAVRIEAGKVQLREPLRKSEIASWLASLSCAQDSERK